jgi:hypothetical protein
VTSETDPAAEAQERDRSREIETFAKSLALVATLLALIPALVGWMSAPRGAMYLGFQGAVDDQMVYAAWMRQAAEGRFLFENRFAVDPQPGLTVHVYFWLLGLVAKVTGIPVALTLARIVFAYLSVRLLGRFLQRLGLGIFAAKTGLILATFGAGVGFMVWERFGETVVDAPGVLVSLTDGRLPVDVWQPEAFLFPSMLVNGLFCASLCLMVGVLWSAWAAADSWRPVPAGAACMAVLMNVHSYDVLILTFVWAAFLLALAVRRRLTGAWALRTLVIGLGALPAAAWFWHVLSVDPVFQARAATPTFSPGSDQFLLGALVPIVLGVLALAKIVPQGRRGPAMVAVGVFFAAWLGMAGRSPGDQYAVGFPGWALMTGLALVCVALCARDDAGWNLLVAWAFVALVAPYFPGLFQRKLAMAMVVPWAVLGGIGLDAAVKSVERNTRNLATALVLLGACTSSLLWFRRELDYIRFDVARTAVQPVHYGRDAREIVRILGDVPGRKVVVAMPGVWNPTGPGQFATPVIPDLNPLMTGLAGATTYAGHWSETPDYLARRREATAVFLNQVPEATRRQILEKIGADYVVAPNPEAFRSIQSGDESLPIADLRGLGEVVYSGNQFLLIRLAR